MYFHQSLWRGERSRVQRLAKVQISLYKHLNIYGCCISIQKTKNINNQLIHHTNITLVDSQSSLKESHRERKANFNQLATSLLYGKTSV